jgi:type I restriction enzyme S subunit
MELKKGYRQTELGVIPDDWYVGTIKELCSIKTGSKNTQDKIDDGIYPFFVRSQTIEHINSYSFDGEAILTAGDGVGTGKIFHYINGRFDFHQRVYMMSNFNSKIEGYYLFQYFSNKFFNRISQMTAKSSVDSIRMEMIADMQVLIPSIKEQSAISKALSETDAYITSLENLIEKKRQIKQGVIQELLKPIDEWETKSLGDIGKTFGGLSGKSKDDFTEGVYPYIPFMNIMSNPIIDTEYFDYVNINNGESQNLAIKGDLFFNGSSETPEEVGMCSVLLNDIPNLYLNSFCFGFRIKSELKMNGLYLSYYFRSKEGRKLFYSMAQGATRYNLSKSNFNKLKIPIPTIEEQNVIAERLFDLDSDIKIHEVKLSKAKSIKQGMIQNLLTGKIRLI